MGLVGFSKFGIPQTEDNIVLDIKIRELHNNLIITGLRPKDRHLSTIPLAWLFTLPRTQKLGWLNQTNLALAQSKNGISNLDNHNMNITGVIKL